MLRIWLDVFTLGTIVACANKPSASFFISYLDNNGNENATLQHISRLHVHTAITSSQSLGALVLSSQ